MKHFADVILNREFDLREEILALENLFMDDNHGPSIYYEISNNFLYWRLRSNYVDFDDFVEGCGIADIVNKCENGFDISLEEYIFYCEFIYNVSKFNMVSSHAITPFIYQNISTVIEKLNYTVHYSNGIWHIVEKSVLVSEAADIVQDNYELGESIYSFNYRETKGNINKKADILCRLYKYIESITPQVKQYGYFGLLEDIKDLSNRLDVRHAPTLKQTTVIEGMGKDEYESWLDELFKLSLSLIILVDYTSKKKDIKELKCELG